jgi:CAAX amino terminal protease family.
MQRLSLYLKRKTLVNADDKAYEVISSIFLAIGFAVLCFLIEMVVSVVLGFLFQGTIVTNINGTDNLVTQLLLFSLPSTICFSVLPITYLALARKWKMEDFGLRIVGTKRSMVIKCLCFAFLGISLYRLFTFHNFDLAIRLLLVFIFVAINEEIVVRGILYRILNNRFKRFMSAIIASFIFAFILHSGSDFFSNFVARFPLSLLLFVLYTYSGDIYSSMMFHFAYNILVNSI